MVDRECRSAKSVKCGVTLLEVVIAITLIASVGLAGLSLTHEVARMTGDVIGAEERLAYASNFFGAVSLWSREELDRRLGMREQGPYALEIVRERDELYIITLLDGSGTEPILRTALFRPRGPSDAR